MNVNTLPEIVVKNDLQAFLDGEPGLYAGVDEDTYHAFDACSNSRLSIIHDENEAKLKSEIDQKEAEEDPDVTAAQQFGRWAHACILEPERFDTDFDKAGTCNAVKGDGTRCENSGKYRIDGKWFCGVRGHAPNAVFDEIETIKESKFDKLIGMRKACQDHPMIGRILDLPSHREISGLWIDEATGLLCKIKVDILADGHALISDYKTTQSVKDEALEWTVWNYGYYRQSPFYLSGCRALGLPIDDFAFIFQEKKAPYFCRVKRIEEPAMAVGVIQLRELMQRYDRAKKSGIYPGYEDGAEIGSVGLPEKVINYDLTDGERSAIFSGEVTV